MGHSTAIDLANSGISLEQSLEYHLRGNHFPPVPTSMVRPCIEAIDAYNNEDYDAEITLPEGITCGGRKTASASKIISAHHLDAWLDTEEGEY
jgi:hypothetical protein